MEVKGRFFVVFGPSVNLFIEMYFKINCTVLFFETPMLHTHAQQVMSQPLRVNLS